MKCYNCEEPATVIDLGYRSCRLMPSNKSDLVSKTHYCKQCYAYELQARAGHLLDEHKEEKK